MPNVAELSGSDHHVRQCENRVRNGPPLKARLSTLDAREGFHVIVALLLASIVFLSTVLIVGALMMRGQWEKLGGTPRDGSAPRE